MRTIKFIKAALLAFLLVGGLSAYSQEGVTIGSNEAPESGALLQVKNLNGVTNDASNSTKGFAFPRVTLTHKNDLRPMLPSAASAAQKATHTGLVVYNTSTATAADDPDFTFKKGLYLWNGTQWGSVASPEIENGLSQTNLGVLRWGGELSEYETKITADGKVVLFDMKNVPDARDSGFRVQGLKSITSNALAVVADVETGKLGYGTVTPAELAFYQSGNQTQNPPNLNVPGVGYYVVDWDGRDASAGGDRITNTGIVRYDVTNNAFVMTKEAMVELTGMVGYRGVDNTGGTVVVNSTIQIRKVGQTNESDWKDYSSVRGVYPGDVSGYRNTLTIPPAMADLNEGDQIRLIIARAPNGTGGLLGDNHTTGTPGAGIVVPYGTQFSKMLKIIVQ